MEIAAEAAGRKKAHAGGAEARIYTPALPLDTSSTHAMSSPRLRQAAPRHRRPLLLRQRRENNLPRPSVDTSRPTPPRAAPRRSSSGSRRSRTSTRQSPKHSASAPSRSPASGTRPTPSRRSGVDRLHEYLRSSPRRRAQRHPRNSSPSSASTPRPSRRAAAAPRPARRGCSAASCRRSCGRSCGRRRTRRRPMRSRRRWRAPRSASARAARSSAPSTRRRARATGAAPRRAPPHPYADGNAIMAADAAATAERAAAAADAEAPVATGGGGAADADAAAAAPPPSPGYRVGQRILSEADGGEWRPGRIIGRRVVGGAPQLKVSVDGYDSDQDEWVDAASAQCPRPLERRLAQRRGRLARAAARRVGRRRPPRADSARSGGCPRPPPPRAPPPPPPDADGRVRRHARDRRAANAAARGGTGEGERPAPRSDRRAGEGDAISRSPHWRSAPPRSRRRRRRRTARRTRSV